MGEGLSLFVEGSHHYFYKPYRWCFYQIKVSLSTSILVRFRIIIPTDNQGASLVYSDNRRGQSIAYATIISYRHTTTCHVTTTAACSINSTIFIKPVFGYLPSYFCYLQIQGSCYYLPHSCLIICHIIFKASVTTCHSTFK